MKTYIIRSADGVMRAKIPGPLANIIFNSGEGFFRSAKYGKDLVKTVFEVTEGSKLKIGDIEIFLWESDLIIPE